MTVEVVAFSSADLDIVLRVPHLPRHDEKVLGQLVGWLPGGTMANFACALSRLGIQTGWMGTVGDDTFGQIVLEDFRRFGVDLSHALVVPGGETMFTVIMVDSSGERAIVVVPRTPEQVRMDEPRRAYLSGAKVLYYAPYHPPLFREVATAARECGARVMIDVETTSGATFQSLTPLLELTDLVSLNYRGLCAVMGQELPLQGQMEEIIAPARRLLPFGPQLIAVTLGRLGAVLVTADQGVYCPGFPVEVADTTGAGDCFNAALVAGHLAGWDLEAMGRFANAAAAISVTARGPRGHLPTREEVLAWVEQQEGSEHGGS